LKIWIIGARCPISFGFVLVSCAIGTLIGGPLGDKFGRKYVIWFSVLGAAPFTLLPYMDLFWTGVLSVVIGIIISSAFPAILVYAQELPKNSEWFLVFYAAFEWVV
jgi:MFS family permease